jgi:hypothetical protein
LFKELKGRLDGPDYAYKSLSRFCAQVSYNEFTVSIALWSPMAFTCPHILGKKVENEIAKLLEREIVHIIVFLFVCRITHVEGS